MYKRQSVSIVLMSIFLLCKEPLLILLQVPEETMAGAMEYLTIIPVSYTHLLGMQIEIAQDGTVDVSCAGVIFPYLQVGLNACLLYTSILRAAAD